MTAPDATIAILNYERLETLRRVLDSARAQVHPRLEVLVVDNASTDGSDRMVETEFPDVRLVRMARNVGCAARNAGVAAARGAIVITIDNDVLLNGTDAVQRVLDAFAVRPALACANFKILDARGALSSRDWCHPRDPRLFADEAFPTDYVLEGASAFRRDVFLSVGGYWERLFIGHEGLDLALRLLDAGHEVLYWPRVSVTHLASLDARPSSRIYYSFTRNGIWVALRNHRAPAAAFDIAKGLALMAFSSLRAGEWRSFVRGLRDAVLGGPSTLAARRPLRSATYRTLRGIRRLRPSLLAKARRHWQERPI